MPFLVHEVRGRTRRVVREYRGGPQKLTLVYRADHYSVDQQNEFADELNGLTRKDEQGNYVTDEPNKQSARKLAEYLEEVIVEADWEDDQGPIPIKADEMAKRLPAGVLKFAFEIIGEDKTGKK